MAQMIRYFLGLALLLAVFRAEAQTNHLDEQINNYFRLFLFDSVGWVIQNNPQGWETILASPSKTKKIHVLRQAAISALYIGEIEKAKEYAIKIRQTDLFYEPTYEDSEALKSLLRKHKKMEKVQASIWSGANRSLVQTIGEPLYVLQGWEGTSPEDTWWENTKDYSRLYTWQAGGQMRYYLNHYIGFFGGIYYQRFQFDYQILQQYKERVRASLNLGDKVRYNQDRERENTISVLSEQVLQYYGGQFGVFVYKYFEKWNTKVYWQQGFAWAGLLQANRIAQKSLNHGSPSISPSIRTDENFYQNNWLGFSKIGLSYHYRSFNLGIEGGYYQTLQPLSQLSQSHRGMMTLTTDYYDLLDRVNLKNIQVNLTMTYTFKHRIK